jgi:hypothetical protein
MRKLDLVGQKFGRLTVLEVCGRNHNVRVWKCQCDCGKQHEVEQNHLSSGRTTSCGCYHKEKVTTHGLSNSPEERAYDHARQRCKPNHNKHAHYFDRGIRFEFTSFEQFYAEVGPKPTPKHSLDRIDNDGNYAPGNIRWATKSEQERNKRCNNCDALKARIKELEVQIASLTQKE